ncbi:MAG: glycerophosphodiester phosphodiesterase family protein [Clostridia bacterium]
MAHLTTTKKLLISISAILLAMFLFCMFFSLSTVAFISHRGYHVTCYENTSEAFINAGKTGDYGIETDLQISLDKEIFCAHDDNPFKNYTEDLSISKTNSEKLKTTKIDAKSSKNIYLCTFKDYLKICKQYNKIAVLDIKTICSINDVELIYKQVEENYSVDKIIVTSYYVEVLSLFKAKNKDLPLSLIADTRIAVENALLNNLNVCISMGAFKPADVQTFHKKGLTVAVWTVNSMFLSTVYKLIGVDFIISDLYNGF